MSASAKFTSVNLLAESNDKLKLISQLTGDSVTTIANRVISEFIADFETKNGADIKKLQELDMQRNTLISKLRGNSEAPAK